jgi:SpoVK/Ycf46/Vps4 family AAA+-type ATPase
MRDELSAEIVPKGVLFMGIPGCGKSLSVKAAASYFQLPLYRLDMIEIFSGRHGKPEGVFVRACRMMEEMAPAVLWFDEIEMAVTSTDAGGEQGRNLRFLPDLDAGENARAVCSRYRQPDRPASRGNDP